MVYHQYSEQYRMVMLKCPLRYFQIIPIIPLKIDNSPPLLFHTAEIGNASVCTMLLKNNVSVNKKKIRLFNTTTKCSAQRSC